MSFIEENLWLVVVTLIVGVIFLHLQILRAIAVSSLKEHLQKDGKTLLKTFPNWPRSSGPFDDPKISIRPLTGVQVSILGIPIKEAVDSTTYIKFLYSKKDGSSQYAWAKVTTNAYRVKKISVKKTEN